MVFMFMFSPNITCFKTELLIQEKNILVGGALLFLWSHLTQIQISRNSMSLLNAIWLYTKMCIWRSWWCSHKQVCNNERIIIMKLWVQKKVTWRNVLIIGFGLRETVEKVAILCHEPNSSFVVFFRQSLALQVPIVPESAFPHYCFSEFIHIRKNKQTNETNKNKKLSFINLSMVKF